MNLSPAGIVRLKRYEACRLAIYKDQAGRDTIGWGHLLTADDKATGRFAGGITQDQADVLFAVDVQPFEAGVQASLTVGVTADQFDSLVSFAYNVGLLEFKGSSLCRAVNDRASSAEVVFEFLRWDKVTDPTTGEKHESRGLWDRRLDESASWFPPSTS